MALATGDVIFWHDFQNSSTDAAGNYNATVSNATFQDTNKLSSNFTHALSFDGTTDKVTLGNVTQLKNVDKFSISWWVYIDNTTAQCFYGTEEIGTVNSVQGFIQNSGGPLRLAIKSVNNRGDLALTGNITTSTWYHMVVVYDGTQSTNANKLKFYLNNAAKSLTFTGTIETASGTGDNLIFGAREVNIGDVYDMEGELQQFIAFNKPISADEVSEIYNSGNGITYSGLFTPAATFTPRVIIY